MGEYTGPIRVIADDSSPLSTATSFANATRNVVSQQFSYIKEHILGDPGGLTLSEEDGETWSLPGGSANMLSYSTSAIEALGNYDFKLPDDLVMERPEVIWEIDFAFDLPPVNASDFGRISDWSATPPTPGILPTISTVTIPSFNSSIGSLDIPTAPSAATITDPGNAPASPGFSYPSAPVVSLPDRPLLTDVTLPSAPSIDLPTLADLEYPTLEPMNIQTYINWSEPTYSPEIWTDVKAQIQTFLAGGSGIRPEIEEAMVARGRDREDRLVRQQEQQATDEWAGRGFTAPPGMLVKRIDNIREEGLLKKLGLQREVVIKAMEEELANIRLAVQQGIVAEQLFVQIFLAATERLFLIERLYVEWEIQKYNLLIEVFKAKYQENLIRAQIYEVEVRAALAEIEVFKALIDAERVKAEVNMTLIQAYTAEIQARESLVNLYKTQVEAVGVQAEVFATEVRAYGEEVGAFAQRVNADKTRFDAYESRVRGEAAKADIIQAEAQAYAAEVQGIETGVRAEALALEGAVNTFRAEVEAFDATIRGYSAKNQTELAALQGNVSGYQADTSRFVAQAQAEGEKSRVELAAWESENRVNLAWFEAQLKEFEIQIQKILNQKELILNAIRAAGDLSTTVAAGALAAMHAGATITGSGSVQGSGSESKAVNSQDSFGWNCDTSTNLNISVEQDTIPDVTCTF